MTNNKCYTDNEDVQNLIYLKQLVSTTDCQIMGIGSRNRKADQAFQMLQLVWRSCALGIRIFNIDNKSVLLYRSKTLRGTQSSHSNIQPFINRWLKTLRLLEQSIKNTCLKQNQSTTHKASNQMKEVAMDRIHFEKQ